MRALAFLMLVGCIDQPNPPLIPTSCASSNFFEIAMNNRLDLLFVIDDSSAMSGYQAALEANAPVFMNILESLPFSPDLHLAVARGSDGAIADARMCGATDVFLKWSHHGIVQNFSGTLQEAFACITRVGTSGSVQHVLTSTMQGLLNAPGFSRYEAYLGLIVISAQDDASSDNPDAWIEALRQFKTLPNHIIASAITHLPSARLQRFIDAFGNLGTIVSIDQASWASAFQVIASPIGAFIGPLCLEGVLLQPANCTFTLVRNIGTPMQSELGALPLCDPNGQTTGACGGLVPYQDCYPSQTKIVICWNGFDPSTPSNPCPDGVNDPPNDTTVAIECAVKCD